MLGVIFMIRQHLKPYQNRVFTTDFKHIIQNMSFVEEFVEQQLSKTLNSGITQQLQVCHSAVEDLLVNLQSLRSGPKAEIIDAKIARISVFLEAKQEILRLIQAEQEQPLMDWLISQRLDNPLLVELVRQEQGFVEEMMRKTIKNIFLNGEKLEEYLEQNQMISSCLSLLMGISEDLSIGKSPTRDKLIGVDNVEGIIWEKVLLFEKRVALFNREVAKIIQRLYEFQISLSQQFRLFFNKNTYSKLSPSKSKLEVFDKPDQIFEEKVVLQPANKLLEYDYSKTQGGDSKFVSDYRQEPLYRTGFPVRDNYTTKLRPRNQVSQLGLNSQLVIGSSAKKDRNLKSELLVQTKSYFR